MGDIWLLTRSTAARSTAALQTAHQVSWLFSLSDQGMSTGTLSCHLSLMALNVHKQNTLCRYLYMRMRWPSLLKYRDSVAWCCRHATWSTHSTPHSGKIGDQGIAMAALQPCIHVSQPSSSAVYPCIPLGRVSCGGAIISQCSRLQRTPTPATLAHGGQHETARGNQHINSFIRPHAPRDAWGLSKLNFWRCIPACRIAGWDCQIFP